MNRKKIVITAIVISILLSVFLWEGKRNKPSDQLYENKEIITEATPTISPLPSPPLIQKPEETVATSTPYVGIQPEQEYISPTAIPTAITTPQPEITPEPSQSAKTDTIPEIKATTCVLSVQCKSILNNIDKLKPDKKNIIPPNGIILSQRKAVFSEGETVFDVLQRELKNNNIHMEFTGTKTSAYIEGIANIYEFDCGELSGWTYKVNGVSPGKGCSGYILNDNDIVEWVYSCDLGRDI